jgi:Domain of unknown function (DUF4411)
VYVIDSSSLIQSYRDVYPPDVHVGLWERLDDLILEHRIVAPEEVLHELEHKDDDVLAWVKERADDFIVDLDDAQVAAVTEILAGYPNMVKAGGRTNRADPFVIALAKVRGFKVVTEERADGGDRWCKIPHVCEGLGVSWTNMVGLTIAEGWSFH